MHLTATSGRWANGLNVLLQREEAREGENHARRVVCVGAHPDDAETGCGGTLARMADLGHDVTILYLTRGEAGTKHLPAASVTWAACDAKEALAKLRAAEARRACEVLGARALFSGQPDGATEAGPGELRQFTELLAAQKPDVVLTHWPIDTHRDHRSAAQLARLAWNSLGRSFALAYYEVMTGIQTRRFQPNWYVDIEGTWSRKRDACYAHVSQSPDRFYRYHQNLEKQRGEESGYGRAEAFAVLN